jgi:MFS family permease
VSVFSALRVPAFRVLWITIAVSAAGTWMAIIAVSLLVLDLTHGSAAALGAVGLAQASAFFLFSWPGGGIADRVDRVGLLRVTQTLMLVIAVAYGILIRTGVLQFWMVLVFAFVAGSILSFDQPARGALMISLVPREQLASAVSIQSTTFNAAAMVGPALGGLVIGRIGLAPAFYANAISFVPLLIVLGFGLRNATSAPARSSEPLLEAIKSGMRAVAQDRVLLPVVVIWATLLFAAPSAALLMPVLGRERLHAGPGPLGGLFSAYSAGAICGALLAGLARTTRSQLSVFAGALLIWALSLISAGRVTSFPPMILALLVLGAAQSAISVVAVSLLQHRTGEHMRGRMMSLNTLTIMGIRPLGDFPAGVLIASVGIAGTTAIVAMAVLGLGLLMLLRAKAGSAIAASRY